MREYTECSAFSLLVSTRFACLLEEPAQDDDIPLGDRILSLFEDVTLPCDTLTFVSCLLPCRSRSRSRCCRVFLDGVIPLADDPWNRWRHHCHR